MNTTVYKLPGTHHLEAVVYSMVEAFGPISVDDVHVKLRKAGNPADASEVIVRLFLAEALEPAGADLWQVAR